MIEVTDEMVEAAALAFTAKPTEATYVVARRMLNAAIELHEQSKPEPLSDAALMALAEECTTQFFNGVHQNATIHFARAIEQAHGIGIPHEFT